LSHKYFKHPTHSIKLMAKEGLRIAIGTDSLASNHELDMRAEARHLQKITGWDWAQTFDAVTKCGSDAMNLGTGELKVGLPADFVVHRKQQGTNPFKSILQEKKSVSAVFVAGKQIF
jgi:cytosine/adenosine deaminase-related metal-dependent hydrolase